MVKEVISHLFCKMLQSLLNPHNWRNPSCQHLWLPHSFLLQKERLCLLFQLYLGIFSEKILHCVAQQKAAWDSFLTGRVCCHQWHVLPSFPWTFRCRVKCRRHGNEWIGSLGPGLVRALDNGKFHGHIQHSKNERKKNPVSSHPSLKDLEASEWYSDRHMKGSADPTRSGEVEEINEPSPGPPLLLRHPLRAQTTPLSSPALSASETGDFKECHSQQGWFKKRSRRKEREKACKDSWGFLNFRNCFCWCLR